LLPATPPPTPGGYRPKKREFPLQNDQLKGGMEGRRKKNIGQESTKKKGPVKTHKSLVKKGELF